MSESKTAHFQHCICVTCENRRTLLAASIDFIRRRHNYGAERRKAIRLALLKQYGELNDGI